MNHRHLLDTRQVPIVGDPQQACASAVRKRRI